MFNRSLKLSVVKDGSADQTLRPTVEVEQIEEIARRTALDGTKLFVAAAATLMTLRTTLNIVEHHSTK